MEVNSINISITFSDTLDYFAYVSVGYSFGDERRTLDVSYNKSVLALDEKEETTLVELLDKIKTTAIEQVKLDLAVK